jgi:hypothetical protein
VGHIVHSHCEQVGIESTDLKTIEQEISVKTPHSCIFSSLNVHFYGVESEIIVNFYFIQTILKRLQLP